MTARWRKLKGELEASSGHDFERRLLPLLRLRWPAIVHPKSLSHLDVQGIDQLLLADGQPLPVVVQCKGFEVHQPLDRSQIAQVRASVDRFHASPYRCATYVLAYNRSGIDRTFAAEARRALDGLVQAGKATEALLWDLNTMGTELAGDMTRRIVQEVQRLATVAQTEHRSPFLFGNVVIEGIPHRCGRLQLRRHDTPQLLMDQEAPPYTDPVQTVRQSGRGWTLIVGSFGSGKTVLSHRLSALDGRTLLYVPAAELRHVERGAQSESALASAIVSYLGIFDDTSGLTDDERRLLIDLAGPLLSARLRANDSPYLLVIDALDENRVYATAAGLQQLTMELSRVQCKVVLTTRREHLLDHLLDYGQPLGPGSRFAREDLRLIELDPWGLEHARAYVAVAAASASGEARTRLDRLAALLEQTDGGQLLVHHPLLLAMTVDIVAEEGAASMNSRAELYRRWTVQKLRRDFSVPRALPSDWDNIDRVVWTLIDVMVDVALRMTSHSDQGVELVEAITEQDLALLFTARFQGAVPSELYTTTSFLEPERSRSALGMRLRFFHRSFQEYFLALGLERDHVDPAAYPQAVRDFHASLLQSRDAP